MTPLRRLLFVSLLGSAGCERSPEPALRATAEVPVATADRSDTLATPRSSAPDLDARYVVVERGRQLVALVPGDSDPIPLRIDLPPPYPVHGYSHGWYAENTPLMSPDGRHLAHVLGDGLYVTDIATQTRREATGLDGPTLIGD